MKMRSLAIVAAALLLSAITSPASAMLHPGMGRFMQRDPAGHPDGMNDYAAHHVMHGGMDPTGLWKISRNNGSFADAEAEKDDTVKGLAQEVGLDSPDFQKWITLRGSICTPGGKKELKTLLESDVICPGEKLQVPNTVIMYWAGDGGDFGKGWVSWKNEIETMRNRGFLVSIRSQETAQRFEQDIQQDTRLKSLHGLVFWGHGIIDKSGVYIGVGTDSDRKDATHQSLYNSWKTEYKMGIGVLYVCGGQAGRSQFSTNAIFWGVQGLLIPVGTPHLEQIVPAGAQGTKNNELHP